MLDAVLKLLISELNGLEQIDYPVTITVDCCRNSIDVPASLCKLSGLTRMTLVGVRCLTLPSNMTDLKKLTYLDLHCITMQQQLPASLFDVVSLTELILSDYSLQKIPCEIGQLVNLRRLRLDYNNCRYLPSSMQKLTQLRELDVSNNRLTCIPPWIGLLRELLELNVNNNRLTRIPPEVCNCVNLRRLSVVGNQLYTLPYRLGDLKSLRRLLVFNLPSPLKLPLTLGRITGCVDDRYSSDSLIIDNCAIRDPGWLNAKNCLRMNGSLELAILCGLAEWKDAVSPWSKFLCRGLYDPRLFLHIAAFGDLHKCIKSIQTSPDDVPDQARPLGSRKRKMYDV
jgi:hypothetical protein